jgi:hypothetical protein
MTKKSINLILNKHEESDLVHKLKIIFPVFSIIILFIFIFSFFTILSLYNSNINRYNSLKNDITNWEQKVNSKRNTFFVYNTISNTLENLSKIISAGKNFYPLLSKIDSLTMDGIIISNASTDSEGNVSLSLIASSSSALDAFVDAQADKDDSQNLLTNILTQGINRDKDGKFSLSLSFKADKSLLK